MKGFRQALVKLTILYTVILLVITVGFSAFAFSMMTRGMDRRPMSAEDGLRPTMMEGGLTEGDGRPEPSEDIRQIIMERDKAIQAELLTNLIIVNIAVAGLGAAMSYFLAKRTLRPMREAYEKQSRFIADASHELRTPLAAIQMENEVLLNGKASTKEYREQIESNLEEIRRLQSLTNCLLDLDTKSDGENCEQNVEEIVRIFVENAVKYDPKGREPRVQRSAERIDVVDKGVGIAEEDLPHIFERFYRAEKSRTSKGYGLGLSLAQKLAEDMGAKIEVKNNKGGGATFSLILPKKH